MRINFLPSISPKKYNNFQKAKNFTAPKTASLAQDVFMKQNAAPISFKGIDVSCAQTSKLSIPPELKDFSTQFEAKIISQMEPKGKTKNPINSFFIEKVGEKFKEDYITGLIKTDTVSLNNAINYLVEKEQIKLPHYGDGKVACFVDNYSLSWLKKHSWAVDLKNTIFYTQDSNIDKTKAELEEIFSTRKNIQISSIEPDYSNKDYKHPSAETIANTIEAYVEYKFPHNKDKQDEFREILCNYLDECTLAFSYQTLAKKCTQQYKLIEKEVKKQGKTMNDVCFVIPHPAGKSYDLINYMFAVENNIKPKKFISRLEAAEQIRAFSPGHKIYAALDDICASGASFAKSIPITHESFYMIFSPIIGSQAGKARIKLEQDEKPNTKFTYLPVVDYKELGYIFKLKYSLKDSDFENLEKYYKNFPKLPKIDIDILMDFMLGGCDCTYSSVFFPYMLPDNSSEIATLLASNFINTDSIHANKGIAGNRAWQISKNNYKKLKEIIEEN